jgi:hypothetical protein
VDVGDPLGATQQVGGRLDSTGHLLRLLHHSGFDVDHADAQLEPGIDVAEDLEVAVTRAGQLENHMVRVDLIEELHEPGPATPGWATSHDGTG